ncbi:MAG: hypothetical protein JST43_15015 [Bacteroidetes bacterium]|nr:hypothetical protein [Bacteroidota bacterium]
MPIHLHQINLNNEKASWDEFDPTYVKKFQRVDDIVSYADSILYSDNSMYDTLKYAEIVGKILRNRFYHGYSYYSLKENWIAALAGATIYNNLAAIVLPDDILKYPLAACSQVSIVRTECFRRRNITYRSVRFKEHYAMEGKIAGNWYYFDSNLEPDFSIVPRKSIKYLIDNNELPIIYKDHIDSAKLKTELEFLGYGELNQVAAPRAKLFHICTKFLSKTLWLLPLVWVFLMYRKRRIKISH